MAPFSNLSESINKHIYSILAVLLIGIVTFGYLSFILPRNQAKEDAKNAAILKGIENQLISYIDDQVKFIDEEKMEGDKFSKYKGLNHIYIDTIQKDEKRKIELKQRIIKFPRVIKLKSTNPEFKGDFITDSIFIDLGKFITKISLSTPFTSFYICPVEYKECQTKNSILTRNITVIDQDSLIHNNRNKSPFNFKSSSKRYYTDHVYIPQTEQTIFFAAGINKTTYQNNVQQINPTLLIFSLIATIIFILGINFIKPIISSYKETLSQIDLIGVVFSSGLLIAVLVVFLALSCWDTTIKERNDRDLEHLVDKIDTSFKQQITTYKSWKKDSLFKKIWENSENEFAKIIVSDDSLYISRSKKSSANEKQGKEFVYHIEDSTNSKVIKYLDGYFRMDKTGLITTNLSKTLPEIPRKYSDRNYFKTLQSITNENQKIEPVLTAVFSREDNKYQLIYAEKDILDHKKQNLEEFGIKGIAFREYFSEELKLPPGTGYMLVDVNGNVLMQNNPDKNLYQNLLNGSQDNTKLISLLAGISPQSFEMESQGIPFQVYGKRLDIKGNTPTFILGIRDMTHLNRLSIFSFTNGFLISIFFGLGMLLLTYTYSVIFYGGRISALSMQHFFHLFPDKSRTYEYKMLLNVSLIAIFLAFAVSLFVSAAFSFVLCIILGINIVFINFITLSIRTPKYQIELLKVTVYLFVFSFCLPVWLFFHQYRLFAFTALFITHLIAVFYYKDWRNHTELKNWKKWQDLGIKSFVKKNEGVNRRAYTRFLTVRLFYQFAVFPFILVSSIYATELNDFTNYYCSFLKAKEAVVKDTTAFIIEDQDRITDAYNCNCEKDKNETANGDQTDKDILQMANLSFFHRPASYEIKNFTFNHLSSYDYFNLSTIFFKENPKLLFLLIVKLLIVFIALITLAYILLNYYSNRFFFYDLMQAGYEKYYPWKKNKFASDQIFIPMIENREIKKLLENSNSKTSTHQNLTHFSDREIAIDHVFQKDKKYEITLSLRKSFILNHNIKEFENEYDKIWYSLPDDQTRYVLFDFAQDQFVNYKNKEIIKDLMEIGIIDCHQLTGRLKLMSPSFRLFVLSKRKKDQVFIKNFKDESKDGTFNKLKFPILLLAVSALTILLYLNKDSYDKVTLVGGSIVSVLAFINKFIEANKSI